MEAIVFIVVTAVAIFLLGKARNFGKSKIWGPIADKMNEKTLQELKEFQEEEERRKNESSK